MRFSAFVRLSYSKYDGELNKPAEIRTPVLVIVNIDMEQIQMMGGEARETLSSDIVWLLVHPLVSALVSLSVLSG